MFETLHDSLVRSAGCVIGLAAAICASPMPEAAAQPGAAARRAVVGDDAPAVRSRCERLVLENTLTITRALLVEESSSAPRHCYVRGTIAGNVVWHMQLPLPDAWNGRFLMVGDGGKDGDLDYADPRLSEGYAVANSNTGHDAGAEPGASFGFNDRQAEIDFGYRAVHNTVNAAKSLIRAYYGRASKYDYFEGCSTGGRQGLMEAQRFPHDFDGIVAGAPVNHYQELNAGHTWLLQRTFLDDYVGNLAYDTDGDGLPDDLTKLDILAEAVLEKCDMNDGIGDGVIDDPLSCDFEPRRDLAEQMCPAGTDAADCFTPAQLRTIEDFYSGPYDSEGRSVLKGRAFGAEAGWRIYIPHEGNGMFPLQLNNAYDHTAYLFYDEDPGVVVPQANDVTYTPDKDAELPEWAWWQFDIDDLTAGRADTMRSITNATDPDLARFLFDNGGKLILWHGWADAGAPPEPTLDYYENVVETTFSGDAGAAREHARLFMFPGMSHCGGGPGPSEWDPLEPLVEWVERGVAPDHVIARHRSDGEIDNERKVCAHPQIAVYDGPRRGADDPANWTEDNFRCVVR